MFWWGNRGDTGKRKRGLDFNSVGIVKGVKIFLSASPSAFYMTKFF